MTGAYAHGRGKRKSQLQRDIETLRELLARRVKYSNYQSTLAGRNSFSKTDKPTTCYIKPQNYAFRQFLLRGNKKVLAELLLLAMACNVNKLRAKIQQNLPDGSCLKN